MLTRLTIIQAAEVLKIFGLEEYVTNKMNKVDDVEERDRNLGVSVPCHTFLHHKVMKEHCVKYSGFKLFPILKSRKLNIAQDELLYSFKSIHLQNSGTNVHWSFGNHYL